MLPTTQVARILNTKEKQKKKKLQKKKKEEK